MLFLGIYKGYNKGLLKQLFSFISVILGYIISLLLSSRLAFLLSEVFPVNKDISNAFTSTLTDLNISSAYHRVISFFIIFFLIKFIFRVLLNTVGVFAKLPVIKTANKLLGAVLGFLEIYIVIFVIVYLLFVLQINIDIHSQLEKSILANIIFEQTPILSKNLLGLFFEYTNK